MNINRAALNFVVNPAAFGVPAIGATAVAASTSATVTAAPNALAVYGASISASDNDATDAAADAVAHAARELFADFPDLPSVHALNVGDVVGDTVVISGLQIEGIMDVSEDVRCHAIVFYNDLIPQADGVGKSYKLIWRSKHDRILRALL